MHLAPTVDVSDRIPGFLGVTTGEARDCGEDLLAVAFGAEPDTALYVGLTICDVYALRSALDRFVESRHRFEPPDLEPDDLDEWD